ncbi:MAG: hypothetical protein GXO45_01490 [Aquificae bacterium]|nr:hypothetical protein [Aquificota bacterium]
MKKVALFVIMVFVVSFGIFWIYRMFFSPERLNIVSRTIETTIGFKHGVVEIYSCGKLVKRFLKVEKLTTATGTYQNTTRPYRFGYGYLDANLDGVLNKEEKLAGKRYFEIPSFIDYIYYDGKSTVEEQ